MTRTLPRACPHCGRINDHHSGPERSSVPRPGDLSICWGCGRLAFYTDRGMRKPTPAEQVQLAADPAVQAARAAVAVSGTPKQANRRHRRGRP